MAGEMGPHSSEPQQSPGVMLTERIAFWGDFFAAKDEEYDAKDEVSAAIEELNELLDDEGLLGRECLVSGEGVWSEYIENEEEGPESSEGQLAEYSASGGVEFILRDGRMPPKEALCTGFSIEDPSCSGELGVWLQFETSYGEIMDHPTIAHEITTLAYLKPNTTSVIPLSELDKIFYKPNELAEEIAENGQQLGTLKIFSEALIQTVKSTKFRRLAHPRQIRIVNNIIRNAEIFSGAHNLGDLDLDVEYGYAPQVTEKGINYRLVELGKLPISGRCLGVTMVGKERLERKAVRRDSDLINKNEGLSLIIELADDSELPDHLGLMPGDILYVPFLERSRRVKHSRRAKKAARAIMSELGRQRSNN